MANSTLPKEIQHEVLLDKLFGPLITKVQDQNNSRSLEYYILKEGLLFFKDRLCIPSRLRGQILKEAHGPPLAAHPGYQKMFASLKEKLFWPRMKNDALEFCKQCLVCKKVKAKRVIILVKLQPLDIP